VETLVIVLVVALVAGGTFWNKRTAALAMAGVEFEVPAPASAVSAAITAAYCDGAKAVLRSVVSRMTVTPAGARSFQTRSSLGDAGTIQLSEHAGVTTVRAFTTELYVGSHPAGHFRSGAFAIGAQIVHGLCKVLGITLNAARMRRFQAGIERKVAAGLRKAMA
jgi:hypothetical protein